MLEEGEGYAREAVRVHLIGGQLGGSTDGIVENKIHLRQVGIPIILLLVDGHNKHLSHDMIHALDVAVAVRRRGACCKSVHAVQLVYGQRQVAEEFGGYCRKGDKQGTLMEGCICSPECPSAANSATELVCVSARRLKRSVERGT